VVCKFSVASTLLKSDQKYLYEREWMDLNYTIIYNSGASSSSDLGVTNDQCYKLPVVDPSYTILCNIWCSRMLLCIFRQVNTVAYHPNIGCRRNVATAYVVAMYRKLAGSQNRKKNVCLIKIFVASKLKDSTYYYY
jgi:hypothetical protein